MSSPAGEAAHRETTPLLAEEGHSLNVGEKDASKRRGGSFGMRDYSRSGSDLSAEPSTAPFGIDCEGAAKKHRRCCSCCTRKRFAISAAVVVVFIVALALLMVYAILPALIRDIVKVRMLLGRVGALAVLSDGTLNRVAEIAADRQQRTAPGA